MLSGPTAKGYLQIFSPIVLNGGLERAACPMGRAVTPWPLPRPRRGPPLTFGNCLAQEQLFTRWKHLLSAGCWGDRRAEISHSVPSICVPTFPSRDIRPQQQPLSLDCTILPPLKAPNPFRRQENQDARRLQKEAPSINQLPVIGIQRTGAVDKKWENLGHQTGSPETAGSPAATLVAQGATKATENAPVPITNSRPIIRATAIMCHKKDRKDERHGHYAMSPG